MRPLAGTLTLAAVLAAGTTAHALEQKVHRAITEDACMNAGLPDEFCERLGVEAYDVDAYEWDDLSAHAQPEAWQTSCQGANAALDRLEWLGADVHDRLADLARSPTEGNAEQVAVQLGRALHTIQDNCAHHGVSNPEHAWFSLSDSCSGTSLSPDVQPGAQACARTETATVMDVFVTELYASGASFDDLSDTPHGWTHWPSRGGVCEFLDGGNGWNGYDTTWNNDIVTPALRDQLVTALYWGAWSTGDVCDGDPDALAPTTYTAHVDTSAGQSRCLKIKAYCLGKADGASDDEPPPWDDGTTGDTFAAGGGCSAAGGSAGGATLLVLAALVVTRRRRR
jgi:uncharacterized protein (TIGR03382 family)